MKHSAVEIEKNPKGSGVAAYISENGKRSDFTQVFPTLASAIAHYEKLAARQYHMMDWKVTSTSEARGIYLY